MNDHDPAPIDHGRIEQLEHRLELVEQQLGHRLHIRAPYYLRRHAPQDDATADTADNDQVDD